ncbi:MAG TPA: N-acetylmuramoyl-L-alanine amidase [Candidatus Limnocylindria bacterium]|nr:N-acetylmuramoyl-L-alanine amidase [Candidatus Limnocylindria bacterium]
MQRRTSYCRLALLIGLFLLALFPNAGPPAVASPRATGQIVANEKTFAAPATHGTLTRQGGGTGPNGETGSTGGETLLYTSDVVDAGQLFDHVGVHWIAAHGTEDRFFLELRTSANGTAWSDWALLGPDEDMHNVYTNEWYAPPQLAVDNAHFAQYRVWLTDGDPTDVVRVGITFMDVNDLNAGPVARLVNDIVGAAKDVARSFTEPSVASAAAAGATRILSRQDWAADENIMSWVPRTYRVQKAVVHHTVTDDGGRNVAATIRSIYYFHAVTRGWGDIGYSYLVDKYGNIWAGRQGGDGTEAGHAYGWNKGSIGIAAVGTYSTTAPPPAMVGAIANIIAMKFAQFGVQPFGADQFTHQEQSSDGSWNNVTSNPPNVQGHRDCNYLESQKGGQTACPGNALYGQLASIRSMAQNAVNQGYVQMPYIETNLPKAGYPGGTINVGVTVMNRGRTTIPAGTNVSYKVLQKGRIVTAQGTSAAIATDIGPGGVGAVTVPLVTPAIGNYIVRWDLQTNGSWWSSLFGTPARDQYFRGADWSADWVSDNVPPSWVAGEVKMVQVTVANDGGRVWNATGAGPVKLGYKWVSNATGNTFPGAVQVPMPFDVQPGQNITLQIAVVAPPYPTNYTMYLDLYKENEFAFADKGIAPDDTPTGVSVDFKAGYQLGSQATFSAGQTTTVPVTITNLGRGTFPVTNSFPINLGYHWTSATGQTVIWDGARTKLPSDLLAGQATTVNASITAPSTGGNFLLKLDLVQEGIAWFSSKGVPTGNTPVTIAGPLVASFGASYQPSTSSLAFAGSRTTVPITVTNTSNFTWPAGGSTPVRLSYHWANAAGSTLVWDGLRTLLTQDVPAGGSVTLQASVAFPSTGGTYLLRWDMVQDGVAWFSGKGVATTDQQVSVSASKAAFYGGSMDVSRVPATLGVGQSATIPLRVQNLSNFDFDSSINLSYHWYDSAGRVVTWDGLRTTLAGMRVNELRAIDATVQTPAATGTYTLRFDIVREGVTWFSGAGMQLAPISVIVQVPPYGATYSVPPTITLAAGAASSTSITIANTGALTWDANFNIAYHIYYQSGAVLVWEGVRTDLPASVAPGQSVTVNAVVNAPPAGTYTIRFDVVQEGVAWFSAQGVTSGSATLQAK